MKSIKESCVERDQRIKVSINSRPKIIQIIGQRKAFCRHAILESSCMVKETVDIDILTRPRNGDRKTMQLVRITFFKKLGFTSKTLQGMELKKKKSKKIKEQRKCV